MTAPKTAPKMELPTTEGQLVDFIYEVRSYDEAKRRAAWLWPVLHDWFMAPRASPAQCDVQSQSDWQPIETAPKDGKRILLFQAGRGAFEGWWHTAWPHPEQYWMDDADSEPAPTYWQPTLALPSADREYDPNVAPCDDAEFGMKP